MLQKIFKLSCILSAISINLARPPIRLNVSSFSDFQGEIDVSPFTKVGNKLYYFGEEKISWFSALLTCRSIGGFLASVEAATEMDDLAEHLFENYSKNSSWWLSGSNLQTETKGFYWYGTGERFQYTDWFAGQPENATSTQNCVCLSYHKTKHQMNVFECKNDLFYICETENLTNIIVSFF